MRPLATALLTGSLVLLALACQGDEGAGTSSPTITLTATPRATPTSRGTLTITPRPEVTPTLEATPEKRPTLAAPSPSLTPEVLTVHFIDVGQGDAILIDKGDTDILVDGGPTSTNVLAYLQGQGVRDIDLLVATHPHARPHRRPPRCPRPIPGERDLGRRRHCCLTDLREVRRSGGRRGRTVREPTRGYTTQMDELGIAVLNPTSQLTGDSNEDSVVFRLTCGEVSVLLTGDATSNSEASMLAAGLALDSDVLKVGHHGSSTSTSHAFLEAVAPPDAVISVGADNTYGHPSQQTLDRLAAVGANVYRTDQDGTVVLTSDCNTYSVTTSRPPGP